MIGIIRSASEEYRYSVPYYPYFTTRPIQGKLGPIVEVETPEAEAIIQEQYIFERPKVVRQYSGLGQPRALVMTATIPAGETTSQMTLLPPIPGYWPTPIGKAGPIIEVESPEAEEKIRMMYPTARIIRKYKEGLGDSDRTVDEIMREILSKGQIPKMLSLNEIRAGDYIVTEDCSLHKVLGFKPKDTVFLEEIHPKKGRRWSSWMWSKEARPQCAFGGRARG